MTLPEVLQIGSRLYKRLGNFQGRMAIYPKKDEDGTWYLLVMHDAALVFADPPDAFEGVPVRYGS
jgi:hypothetical protein